LETAIEEIDDVVRQAAFPQRSDVPQIREPDDDVTLGAKARVHRTPGLVRGRLSRHQSPSQAHGSWADTRAQSASGRPGAVKAALPNRRAVSLQRYGTLLHA
jgi:hypothetical protein